MLLKGAILAALIAVALFKWSDKLEETYSITDIRVDAPFIGGIVSSVVSVGTFVYWVLLILDAYA